MPAGRRSSIVGSTSAPETQPATREEENEDAAADRKRLDACNEQVAAAVLTAMVAMPRGGATVDARTLDDTFDLLRRSLADAVSTFSDAQAGAIRAKLKAQASWFQMKLQNQRKATHSQLSSQQVEMEASYTRKLSDTVKELCSGDKILLAAQARAEEAEAALEKLQEEYKKLEHAYASADAEVKPLKAQITAAKEAEAAMHEALLEQQEITARTVEEVHTRQAVIDDLRQAVVDLEDANLRAEQEMEVAKEWAAGELLTLRQEKELAGGAMSSLKAELEGERRGRTEAEAEVATLREQMDKVTSGGAGKIKMLQEALDRQTNQVSALQEQVRKLEAELAHQAASNAQQSSVSEQRLQEALQALQARDADVLAYQAAMAPVVAELSVDDDAPLLHQLQSLIEAFGLLRKEVKGLHAKAKEKEKEKKPPPTPLISTEELETLKKAVTETAEQRASFELQLHEAESAKDAAEGVVDRLTREMEAVRAELGAWKGRVGGGATDAWAEAERLKAEIESCKRAAAEACNSFPKGQEPAMPFNTLTAINSMSLHELIAELLKNYREAMSVHHKLTSALESMSAAMDKLSHAGKAERTALVNVALSSLKQLSTHLKYCLGGLRHGLERPAELPAPWPMGIKSLSKTQSLPAIPPAAAPRWETSDIYKRRPGGGVVVEGRSRTSFVEPRPPEHAMQMVPRRTAALVGP